MIISAIAAVFYVTGVALLFQTALDWPLELLLAASYVGAGSIELYRFRRRLSGVSALRIFADGAVRVHRHGKWYSGCILSGSMVLRHTAWLRIDGEPGARVDCLCRAQSTETQQWRRFRVIYRHTGGEF